MFFVLTDILQALVLIFLAFSGFQSSRKRIWSKTTQWHITQWHISHGSTWRLWLVIKILNFPRHYGIYSIYDKSNPLLNEIKPMINALWPITTWGKNLQQTKCKNKLIQFNAVLSEGNNWLFFCDNNLNISQIQNWQEKMNQKDRLHIHIT